MRELLIETLSAIGFPPVLQGTMPNPQDEPWADTFITFWQNESEDTSHADGFSLVTVYDFTVIVYSTDPTTLMRVSSEARTALKAAGFVTSGEGNDIASGEPSHTGHTQDYRIIKTTF